VFVQVEYGRFAAIVPLIDVETMDEQLGEE
jgi:hypothetical protein